jgi:hypothetical protein
MIRKEEEMKRKRECDREFDVYDRAMQIMKKVHPSNRK